MSWCILDHPGKEIPESWLFSSGRRIFSGKCCIQMKRINRQAFCTSNFEWTDFISVDIRVISSTSNQQKAFEFPLESQSELDKSKSRSWCFEPVDLTSFSSWSKNQHAHLYNCRTYTFKYTGTSQGEGNRISVNALQSFPLQLWQQKERGKGAIFLATNCIY